ncbi:MAG: 3-methyladenine DNA glycosylase Tag [Candidatus Azotimanducaceae bacterium]
MLTYNNILDIACRRKGSEAQVEALLSPPRSNDQLTLLADGRYLSAFSKKVFQSGFVWRVVEAKWDNFENLFWEFDVDKLLLMPDEMLDQRALDKRIIRNQKKVWAIRENAMMIDITRRHEQCSFAEFIATWPVNDITGLWLYLKKHGCRLGGNTGPYALRTLGKDTFLFTRDVEGYLREHEIVETGINTRSALTNAQRFFNDLQQTSGRSLTELSQLVSLSHGENRAGIRIQEPAP